MRIPKDNTAYALTFSDRYLDLEGLAVYSSLGKTTLRKHMKANALPYYKLDGKILVRQCEFDQWMDEKFKIKALDLDAIADECVKEVTGVSDE